MTVQGPGAMHAKLLDEIAVLASRTRNLTRKFPDTALGDFYGELARLLRRSIAISGKVMELGVDNNFGLTLAFLPQILADVGGNDSTSSQQMRSIVGAARAIEQAFHDFATELTEQNAPEIPGVSIHEIESLSIEAGDLRAAALEQQSTYAADEIERLSRTAQSALDQLTRLTQRGGELQFASDFAAYARAQEIRTWQMRGVAGLLIVASAYIAYLLSGSMKDFVLFEVVRFLVVVPVLFFGFYFIREASHHRDAAQAANEKAVRLVSVDAFTAGMETADRNQIRLQLGLNVFGDSSYNADPRTNTEAPAEMKDAVELVKAVGEVLRKQTSK